MNISTFSLGLKGVVLLSVLMSVDSTQVIGQPVSFNRDIRPILSDRCFACHGPDQNERKAELRLDIAEGPDGAYRSLDGVVGIKPGDPAASEVWHRVLSTDEDEIMPPPKSHKQPLTDAEAAKLRQWIEDGAVYEKFWAFEIPRIVTPKAGSKAPWSRGAIDGYVFSELVRHGLEPSAEADKRTLIRRVTLDLTGLPPTREEIARFLADDRPDAYERVVNELLSRPTYGEHMARYWLDLVRFADTNGMHKDFYRNFIAYRDWVIRAFNQNLGYDDFLRYQLAGDLYPEPSNDQLVASGFNRLHLIIDRGTALPEESFTKNVFDRVAAVGTVFMGMTVNCAMCHDHKYDPLTQKDFYALFAFFNNIDAEPETRGRPANGLQPPFISLSTPEQARQLSGFDMRLKQLEDSIAEAKRTKAPTVKQLEGQRNALKKERDQLDKTILKAMVMKEREDVRPAHFLIRGEYDNPGPVVPRNTPEFMHPLKRKSEVPSRMDLAEWFVDPENPLTARVAVNRLWQQFFGVGLVRTSEDLGAQGEVPSHPLLLDFLAVRFTRSGWDVKALVKEIVLSSTYRQTSDATREAFSMDPDNRKLARASRYRMDAEMVRDQILATSGRLSKTMYGPSVKPPQPDGLWKSVTMIGERFKPDSGESIYRRSLYTYWKRGMPPPQMTIMNAPVRDACTARRERTNTPAQALLLLNENEYLDAARHLAQQVVAETKTPAERVASIYEIITGHLPDDQEQSELLQLVADLQERYRSMPGIADDLCAGLPIASESDKIELAAWTMLTSTIYNLDVTKNRN